MPKKLTTSDFIKLAKKVHGDKYDYSKAVYTKAKGHVEIICPSHGSFIQRCDHHLKGSGCKRCAQTKHGLASNPLYNVWYGMMNRCYDTTHKSYPNYGLKGVKVCEDWHTLQNFVSDMGKSYADFIAEHGVNPQLDKDIKGDGKLYCYNSCTWVSSKTNCRDRTSSKISFEEALSIRVLLSDTDLTQKQIADMFNVSRGTVSDLKLNRTWVDAQPNQT